MKSMKVAFITRIKTEDDLVKDGLTSIVSEADKSGIKDKYILLKTKNSVNVKHKINGIDQLSPPENGELFLFSLRLREEQGADKTLPSLIAFCREKLKEDIDQEITLGEFLSS